MNLCAHVKIRRQQKHRENSALTTCESPTLISSRERHRARRAKVPALGDLPRHCLACKYSSKKQQHKEFENLQTDQLISLNFSTNFILNFTPRTVHFIVHFITTAA